MSRFGHYRLKAKIGSGSTGNVYQATDCRNNQNVAIKLFNVDGQLNCKPSQPQLDGSILVNAPNAVNILEQGEDELGQRYCVMELIQGFDLLTVVAQQGPIPDGRTIDWLKQIGRLLEYLHALGLVHRDLKPSNVMICLSQDGTDGVKVLDFSSIAFVDEQVQAVRPYEPMQRIHGTPHYMAPELIQSPSQLNTASDVYAFGCLSYHLLAGHPPFQGNNPLQICLRHTRDAPEPLGKELAIDKSLIELVMSCLAKKPLDRPTIADCLSRLSTSSPVQAWCAGQNLQWWSSANRTLGKN